MRLLALCEQLSAAAIFTVGALVLLNTEWKGGIRCAPTRCSPCSAHGPAHTEGKEIGNVGAIPPPPPSARHPCPTATNSPKIGPDHSPAPVYRLGGNPVFQNTTPGVETDFLCVRTRNVTRMCEYIMRADPRTPARRRADAAIDWEKHWAPAPSAHPHTYNTSENVCVVLGSSMLMNIYNYTTELSKADVIFVVNGIGSFRLPPDVKKVIETADADHLRRKEIPGLSGKGGITVLMTSFRAYRGRARNVGTRQKVAMPYGLGTIKKTSQLVSVQNPGFTSGIFVTLWARQYCQEVKVIGFYGYDRYEHGKIGYSTNHPHRPSEKTGQFRAMALLLRLHELGQIELVL
jgi:hypothetical protein